MLSVSLRSCGVCCSALSRGLRARRALFFFSVASSFHPCVVTSLCDAHDAHSVNGSRKLLLSCHHNSFHYTFSNGFFDKLLREIIRRGFGGPKKYKLDLERYPIHCNTLYIPCFYIAFWRCNCRSTSARGVGFRNVLGFSMDRFKLDSAHLRLGRGRCRELMFVTIFALAAAFGVIFVDDDGPLLGWVPCLVSLLQ